MLQLCLCLNKPLLVYMSPQCGQNPTPAANAVIKYGVLKLCVLLKPLCSCLQCAAKSCQVLNLVAWCLHLGSGHPFGTCVPPCARLLMHPHVTAGLSFCSHPFSNRASVLSRRLRSRLSLPSVSVCGVDVPVESLDVLLLSDGSLSWSLLRSL